MSRLASAATKSLTIRYTIALIAIATTCLASQMVVQSLLAKDQSQSHVVHIAGRQRMLSQRIAKVTYRLAASPQNEDTVLRVDELKTIVKDFVEKHSVLRNGDGEQQVPALRNGDALMMLDQVQPHLDSLSQVANQVVDSFQNGSPDHAQLQVLADQMAKVEPAFLASMDRVVFLIADQSAAEIDRLIWFERLITLSTLILLALEAFFVFRPAVQRVGTSIDNLRIALSQARSANDVAEQAISERNLALSAASLDLKRLSSEIDSLLMDQMLNSASREDNRVDNRVQKLMSHVQGTLGKLSYLVDDVADNDSDLQVSRSSPRALVCSAVQEFQRNNFGSGKINVTMDQRLPASLLVDEQMFLNSIVYLLQGMSDLAGSSMTVHVGYDDRSLQLIVQVKVECLLKASDEIIGEYRDADLENAPLRLEAESLDLLLAKRTVERLGGTVHTSADQDRVSIFLPLDETKRMTRFAAL